MELKSLGGVYGGNVKPTPFLCLILKAYLYIQNQNNQTKDFSFNFFF
jgi:pre-mRNA-splicing factor 38A